MKVPANLPLLFALFIAASAPAKSAFAATSALASTTAASATTAQTQPQKFIGVTRASHDAQLALPVEGLVTKITVAEGQRVEAGQSLLELDNQLQTAEARRRQLIKDDTAQVKTLEHNLKIVKSLLESSRQLYGETGSISEDEVKKLEMQYVTMDGELQSLKMQKKREAVEYEAALEDLKRRTLSAPRAGIVSEILVETGEWATPQQAVVRLVDPRECHLELNIEERFARHFTAGTDVPVYMDALTGEQEILGRVIFVAPIADQASGLVRVKIGFNNHAGEIWPGLPATVLLPQQDLATATDASATADPLASTDANGQIAPLADSTGAPLPAPIQPLNSQPLSSLLAGEADAR